MTNKSRNISTGELSDGRIICWSYGVPVAAFIPGRGYVQTAKKYSSTTSKHANQFTERRGTVVSDEEFRKLIAVETCACGCGSTQQHQEYGS